MSEEETMDNGNAEQIDYDYFDFEKKNKIGEPTVLVPASFIDKVRSLCENAPVDEYAHRVMVLYTDLAAVREALAEIDKGE